MSDGSDPSDLSGLSDLCGNSGLIYKLSDKLTNKVKY